MSFSASPDARPLLFFSFFCFFLDGSLASGDAAAASAAAFSDSACALTMKFEYC